MRPRFGQGAGGKRSGTRSEAGRGVLAGGGEPAGAEELAAYRNAVAVLTDVFTRFANGDLEARVPELPGPAALTELRDRINDATDIGDAFVREAAASLTAASTGQFYRSLLTRGLPGAYRDGARIINRAREAMRTSSETVARNRRERQELAYRVQEVAVQVAAASTEFGASADTLSLSTRQAVGQAEAAVQTVRSLEESSRHIQEAVTLIKRVAAQTRLLALNATIEAARAAAAGRGFAVVAGEVKTLADEVNRSSDDIAVQVASAQRAATDAIGAIHAIAEVVEQMDQQVAGVAAAASGGLGEQAGLSQMAETLRLEIEQLVGSGSSENIW